MTPLASSAAIKSKECQYAIDMLVTAVQAAPSPNWSEEVRRTASLPTPKDDAFAKDNYFDQMEKRHQDKLTLASTAYITCLRRFETSTNQTAASDTIVRYALDSLHNKGYRNVTAHDITKMIKQQEALPHNITS